MKNVSALFILLFIALGLSAQSTYPIRTDTLKVYTGSTTPGAGGELLLQNASRTVLNGVLTNINTRGNTEFRNLTLTNTGNVTTGSILGITGQSTVALPWLKPYMDTLYTTGSNLTYRKNGNTYNIAVPVNTYTAGNLLTLTGNQFNLGGTSTGSTILSNGSNPFNMFGIDGSGGISTFAQNNASDATNQLIGTSPGGNLISELDNNYAQTSILSSDISNDRRSGVSVEASQASLFATSNYSSSPQNTGLFISQGASSFTDNINFKGLSYPFNYAANNTSDPRWLVDKGYVDSIAGSPYTIGNLLTNTAGTLELGGTATKATGLLLQTFGLNVQGSNVAGSSIALDVNGSSTPAVNINGQNAAHTTRTGFTVDVANISFNSIDDVGFKQARFTTSPTATQMAFLTNTNTVPTAAQLLFNSAGNIMTDNINATGLSYAINYAQNNGSRPRWIVDKGYVDSLTTATQNYKPMRDFYADTSTTSTTPGVYQALYRLFIPPNSITTNGQKVVARYGGEYAANANSKGLEMIIGGTVVGANSDVQDNPGWQVNVSMVRTGTSTARVSYQADGYSVTATLTGLDFTTAIQFDLYGAGGGTAGDVTAQYGSVTWISAAPPL